MAKKPCFGPVFGTFGPNFGPKNFFRRFYTTRCLTLLQPVIYAVSRTANEPDLRQWKNPNFEPNFGPFWAKFGPQKFFMAISSTRCYTLLHCCKLSLYALSR